MTRQFSGQFYLRDETVVVVHWNETTKEHFGHPIDTVNLQYKWDKNGYWIPISLNKGLVSPFDLTKKCNPQTPFIIKPEVIACCKECELDCGQ